MEQMTSKVHVCLQRRMQRSRLRRMQTSGGVRLRRGTPLTWTPRRCTRATARRPALLSATRLTWLEVSELVWPSLASRHLSGSCRR